MVLPANAHILIVAEDGKEQIAAEKFSNAGFSVDGYLKGGFDEWKNAEEPIDMVIDIEADEFAMDIPFDEKMVIIDVRTEDEYNKNAEFEGHEIYSKPYGFFNNEALNAPNPVGISTVGNPKYGEWKTDSSTGQSFWSYYGQFRLLSDVIDIFAGNNHRYYRSDYDHWNNNYRNQRYTGSEDRYSYGGSVMNSSGNYKSNGSVNNGNSLRGVGAVTRGRGASGGGK